ncbi:MAG: cell division protein ZapA [Pelagimonas sp.]|jgi:cell division protein ZapA
MSQIEVEIHIGERVFEVACQEGEQQYLQAAAKLLDAEAQVLVSQIGRMPEPRLLLMSGLMLADKTGGLEERLRAAEDKIGALQAELDELKAQPPEQVEVARIPDSVNEMLAELAAQAESLAATVEEKTSSDG